MPQCCVESLLQSPAAAATVQVPWFVQTASEVQLTVPLLVTEQAPAERSQTLKVQSLMTVDDVQWTVAAPAFEQVPFADTVTLQVLLHAASPEQATLGKPLQRLAAE